MEFNEVREKKKELERNIYMAVNSLVEAFRDECDITPSYIGIAMINESAMNKINRDYIVGDVSVEVNL